MTPASNVTKILILSVATLGLVLGYMLWLQTDVTAIREAAEQRSILAKAEEIVSICSAHDHKAKCYDEEIPKVMEQGFSMEEAFEVTATVQELDRSYQYCHVLGHELSARETAKDPSKWKDVVARAPIGLCSNGGVHGAFQERFRVESMVGESVDTIEPELRGICEPREGWQPSLLGQATCTHALGHLTMYVTGGEIVPSLELCDRLHPETRDDGVRQLCYDGAFMQIYQPLEPEDFALIEGKEVKTQEASTEFCSNFTGAQLGSCLSESWPLYRDDLAEPETILSICERSKFDEWQHQRCKNAVFYVAMAQANLDINWANEFCAQLPQADANTCFANAASRLIEVDSRNIDEAIALCEMARETRHEGACYDELVKLSNYTFIVGTPEFFELCSSMAEPWQSRCFATKQNTTSLF